MWFNRHRQPGLGWLQVVAVLRDVVELGSTVSFVCFLDLGFGFVFVVVIYSVVLKTIAISLRLLCLDY